MPQAKKPGPKPKPASAVRSDWLKIRATKQEARRYEKAAKAAGLPFSTWARQVLDAAAEKEVARTRSA